MEKNKKISNINKTRKTKPSFNGIADDKYVKLEDTYRGRKILITGGLGFIGSNLAIALCNMGAEVIIVDSLIEDYGGNLFNIQPVKDKVRVNIADVRGESSMNYLVKNMDYIFNLAGQVSHIDSMKDPYTDLDINCKSQLSLLESCKKYNKDVIIIYAGTRQQYGKPDYLPVDEKHPVHPTDVNGINMMAGEWYHILYNNVYGIRSVSLRLTNTYGPRQLLKHNRQGFFGWFVRQILEGSPVSIFGDGMQKRDFNFVGDAVRALLIAGANEHAYGNFYNLGGPERISLLELVKMMVSINGSGSYNIVPFPPERKIIDIGDFYADFSKIKKELKWSPEVNLEEGLGITFEYYKKYKDYYF